MQHADSLIPPFSDEAAAGGLGFGVYVHPKIQAVGEAFLHYMLRSRNDSSYNSKRSGSTATASVDTVAGQSKSAATAPAAAPFVSVHLRRSDFCHLGLAADLETAANLLLQLARRSQAHAVSPMPTAAQ